MKKCEHCDEQSKKELQKLEGFHGWLAVFGFSIFVTPIFIIYSLLTDLEAYDGVGIIFNILIVIAYIWLNYLMVKTRKEFKKWFLGIGITRIVLVGIIAIGDNYVLPYSKSELFNMSVIAFQTIFYVTVCSLYLWNSKRVKNTFIN